MTIEERDAYIAEAIRRRSNDGKSPRKKWTPEEVEVRNEAIFDELGKGKSLMKIYYELSDRWGCAQSSIEKYVREAKKALMQKATEGIEEYRSKMIEKLERLAEEAERSGDRKSMLAAYDQISKLSGAYTNKIEANVDAEIKFEFGGE